jgi:uncharacterized protein YjbI with pentapeptide repeats
MSIHGGVRRRNLHDLQCLDRADMGALRHGGLLRVGSHRFRVRLAGPADSSSARYQVTPLGRAPSSQAGQIGKLLEARHQQLQTKPAVFGNTVALRHGCEALAELHHADMAAGDAMPKALASQAEPILQLLRAGGELVCEGRHYGVRVDKNRITVMRTDLPRNRLLRFGQAIRDLFVRGSVVSRACTMQRMLQAAKDAHDAHPRVMGQDNASVAVPSAPSAPAPAPLSLEQFKRTYRRDRNLAGATLRSEPARTLQCDLRGAWMPRVGMGVTHWEWLDLTATNAMYAAMRGIQVEDGCFVDANLAGADLTASRLAHVDLSRATLAASLLGTTQFVECEAPGANFDGADLTGCHFGQCDLTGATFRGAKLGNVVFQECQLVGADFRGADLSGASLHGGDARGARFHGATLSEISLGDGQCLDNLCLEGVKVFSVHFLLPGRRGDRDRLLNRRQPYGGRLLNHIAAFRGDRAHMLAMLRPIAVALLESRKVPGQGPSNKELYNQLLPSAMDIVAADDAWFEDDAIKSLCCVYGSWLLIAGGTMLVGWEDSHDTLRRCLMYALEEAPRLVNSVAQISAGIMQLVFRAQADDVPAAIRQLGATLEAEYLERFGETLRQRVDEARTDILMEPHTFALMAPSGCAALLITRDYFANRLLGETLSGPKKGYHWAEYLVIESRSGAAPAWAFADASPACDFAPFPLLARAFGAGMQDHTRANYLDSLGLGEYRGRFDAAFRQVHLRGNALVTISHQTALGRIFAPLLDDGHDGPGQRQLAPRLADAHLTAILDRHRDILGQPRDSRRRKAYLLLCLAVQFVRLSSDQAFGNEEESPYALRLYAAALLDKACELDKQVRDVFGAEQWMQSLCGTRSGTPAAEYSTCTTMLYYKMRDQEARLRPQNDDFSLVHTAIWPKAWM